MNILQVLLRYVIGQLFLGFFVSLVFSKRYITPSNSHFEAFSGISRMCDSSDASLECLFSRTCSHKLGIVSIPGDFYLCSLLISLQFCCWLFSFISFVCFIHSYPLLNPFSSRYTLHQFPEHLDIFSGGCFLPHFSIKLLCIIFENHFFAVRFLIFVSFFLSYFFVFELSVASFFCSFFYNINVIMVYVILPFQLSACFSSYILLTFASLHSFFSILNFC